MAEDDLLTVYEIAEQLKVNQQTVRNWIDRGELSAIRVGARRVRVRRTALEDFLGRRDEQSAQRTNSERIAALERQLAELTRRVARLEPADEQAPH